MFSQVTVSPTSIVTVLGMKQFGSHPGVDDPTAFSTVTSANAPGTAKRPIEKITKSEVIMM